MFENYCCRFCGGTTHDPETESLRKQEKGVDGRYHYVRCLQCDGIQIHPFPEASELQLFRAQVSQPDEQDLVSSLTKKLQALPLRKKLNQLIKNEDKVLKVGAPLELLEQIKKKENITYCTNLQECQDQKRSYDVVYLNNDLEHTTDPLGELKKACGLLKPTGYIIGQVADYNSWEHKLFRRYWSGHQVPGQTFHFEPNFLIEKLRESGFRNVELEHFIDPIHWSSSFKNYLGRDDSKVARLPSSMDFWLRSAGVSLDVLCLLFKKSGSIRFYAQL